MSVITPSISVSELSVLVQKRMTTMRQNSKQSIWVLHQGFGRIVGRPRSSQTLDPQEPMPCPDPQGTRHILQPYHPLLYPFLPSAHLGGLFPALSGNLLPYHRWNP